MNKIFENKMAKASIIKKLSSVQLIMIAGAAGIILMLVPNLNSPSEIDAPETKTSIHLLEYEKNLESKLTDILGCIDGIGKLHVAVTLDSGTETVYAMDFDIDSDGKERTEHIILNGSGDEHALAETIWEPSVRGIAIVCQGADNIEIKSQIIDAVSALTGVTSNRISIAKMK